MCGVAGAYAYSGSVPEVDVEVLRTVETSIAGHARVTMRRIARAAARRLPLAPIEKPKTNVTIPVRDWRPLSSCALTWLARMGPRHA